MTAMVYRLAQSLDEDFYWAPTVFLDANNATYQATAAWYMQIRKDPTDVFTPALLSFGPNGAPNPFNSHLESVAASGVPNISGAYGVQLTFKAPQIGLIRVPPIDAGVYLFDVLYINSSAQAPVQRKVVARGTIEFRAGPTRDI